MSVAHGSRGIDFVAAKGRSDSAFDVGVRSEGVRPTEVRLGSKSTKLNLSTTNLLAPRKG